jgi:protein-tyrosine-phosphatase
MTGSSPQVYFLHYWGKGPAATLAAGFRSALDQTGQRGLAQNAPLHPVVFVCEHGAARSVVAAAEFNRLAAEQNLPWRAVARGVHPQESISDDIQSLLAKDGISVAGWKPQAVADADVRGAERVVTLACELPASASVPGVTPESWNIQQVGDGTAITQRVRELLKALAASQGK